MEWTIEHDDDGNGAMTVFDSIGQAVCVVEGQAIMDKDGLDLRIVFESMTEARNDVYTIRISAVDLAVAGEAMDASKIRIEAGPGAPARLEDN